MQKVKASKTPNICQVLALMYPKHRRQLTIQEEREARGLGQWAAVYQQTEWKPMNSAKFLLFFTS